ncbi:unnamed protein product [Gadus morhua 'NCC']
MRNRKSSTQAAQFPNISSYLLGSEFYCGLRLISETPSLLSGIAARTTVHDDQFTCKACHRQCHLPRARARTQ